MDKRFVGNLVAIAVAGLVQHAAVAAPLTAGEVLGQFNAVIFGNLNSNSEIEGRTLVGGNLLGTGSTYATRTLPASGYAALTVGGNVVANGYVNVNGGGSAAVAGNVKYMNMNGGTAYIGGNVTGNVNGSKVTGASVTVPDFSQTMLDLAAQLQMLSANSSISVASNRATFNAAPDADGLAVFDITDSNFFNGIGEIAFNLNGARTVIVNVDLTSATIAENFLGGAATAVADKVLWNFSAATSLAFNAEFGGSVLAPQASVSNSISLDGTLIAASLTQRGELHQYSFTGTLPGLSAPPATALRIDEPSGWALLGASAIAGLATRRRRRR